MKILVTGGCGFIGSNFIRYMLGKYENARITNLDKLTYCGNPENLSDLAGNGRYNFVKGDICDARIVGDAVSDAEIVINFAAESHVDRSIKYPDDFVMTNIFGLKVLLEAARKKGISKFIQIGTDEVYGSVPEGSSTENDLLKPTSPYSSTKAAGDLMALSFFRTYGLPVIVTRSSNNFGPYQYPEKVIPLFVTNLLRNEKIPMYGDGANVRDWISVADNCAAIDTVLHAGKNGEIYNIGGGNTISNMELASGLLDVMGKDKSCIRFVNDRPGHDRRYALNSEKTKKLGWKTSGDFYSSLEGTVKWYSDNEKWWAPLRQKAEIIKW